MKPIKTETTNLKIVLTDEFGERVPGCDLPAQRVMAFDPRRGQSEDEAGPAIETVWEPTLGERRALANGAPIELLVWGEQHPPVSLNVGEPTVLESLLSRVHVARAFELALERLAEHMREESWPDARGVLELWERCIEETRQSEATSAADAAAAEAAPDVEGNGGIETP